MGNMELYADVIVDISHEKLDKSFQYRVPEHLKSKIQVGMTVKILFGRANREMNGYVINLTDQASICTDRIKEILDINERAETIESKMMELAAWIRSQYGSTMNQALKTVLPVKAKVQEKQKKTIRLLLTKEDAQEYLKDAKRKHYVARARLIEALLASETKVLSYQETLQTLQITSATLQPLVKQGIVAIDSDRVYRGAFQQLEAAGRKQQIPNEQQQTVIRGILDEFRTSGRPCLIHGVTGSGKTLVYMELIQNVLNQGKQVIVLIPEIALTYQTVRRFYEYFGNQVSILHSRLSQGERYDQMQQAREGRVKVMIGPRSALFTPFPDLGMIIIDEEHENSYKSETMPRYHAREVAIQRGKMEQAQVVLGSATPSVESYYRAKKGEYALFSMTQRYEDRPLPKVEIINLREELKAGNRSMISEPLAKAIQQRLQKGEQTMLFLNRRGYAGFVSCRSCGYVAKCPHCDVSMSLHNYGRLICHYCGYETEAYQKCPSCGFPYIGGFKAGTQQIEKMVKKMFPKSRVLRMDFDTTQKKEGHAKILEAFNRREADILIGTQMIVKGHDFPNVTLVGVLAADLSLNETDFRSGERTFQLLTQAVGRAGRGVVPGEAFVQTYQPEHYSIQAAISQDYDAFYEEEMAYRTLMKYPPASAMMAVLGGSENEQLLEQGMKYIGEYIERLDRNRRLQVIGPAPEAISRVQDIYRQVMYVKHKDRNMLTVLKDKLEEYIEMNKGFSNIHIQFDFYI